MSKNTSKSHSAAPALNENGVSAKKAESSLVESCDNGNNDVGQSCSVPVGQKDVCAPHFEPEQLLNGSENCRPKVEPAGEHTKEETKKPEPEKEKADEMKSEDSKSDDEESKSDDDKSDQAKLPMMDLGVAAGLALLAVDQAGKVIQDASKNWEEKVDAVAQRAHETIELAQRAIKHPVGETMKQVDHMAHPVKEKKAKKAS